MIFTILVSFSWDKCTVSTLRVTFGHPQFEKISNNVDFNLWGNRATTWEYFLTFSSETKIMKITHSALLLLHIYTYTKKVYLAFTEREHTRWTRDYTSPKQELNFFEGWELQEQWMSNGVWRSVCTQVYDWILEGKNPLLFDFSAFFSQVHIASPWLMLLLFLLLFLAVRPPLVLSSFEQSPQWFQFQSR